MKLRLLALIGLSTLLLFPANAVRADWSPFGEYWNNAARAAAQNDAYQVQHIVATGGNPNEPDENERTGLHIAALNGNLQIAAILIRAKAKLDIKDKLGNTPLHYAAERGQLEMAKLLLDVGASVDPENRNGMTPLMVAASRGELDMVRVLLDRGANPAKSDFTGRNAESWASEGHRPAVVQAIKRAEAGGKRS